MMSNISDWKESGIYIFVALSEEGYASDPLAAASYPDAARYDGYRLININKEKVDGFIDYFSENGIIPHIGISEETPMLLTWEEALEFSRLFPPKFEEEEVLIPNE